MNARNILVVQGGGPTQVLNTTLAAIVEEAERAGAWSQILGSRSGMQGLTFGNFADLTALTTRDLEGLRSMPGAALGSSRYKLSEADLTVAAERLDQFRVRDVIAIGGNGTMRAAEALSEHCGRCGLSVRVAGVPKTVDNDVAVTDRCPGYGSAARYVAQATRDLGMDVRSLPQPVSILETMGRSVGWLAAAAAAGKRDAEDAPHLILLPEKPFVMEDFLARVDACVGRLGWCVAVAAEGIRDEQGAFVYQVEDPAQADALKRPITGGVAQYLAEAVARHLKLRCRSEKPGLLGRCSMLHVSEQDMKDADLVGRAGVRALLEGRSQCMVALRPLRRGQSASYDLISLDQVSAEERRIPAEWISEEPVPLGPEFFQYVKPLIAELASHPQPTFPDYRPSSRDAAPEEEETCR
ncbi:MAG: diphosphate--fructose-6-phosphate 1-phosphotransferase [Terracidiphilus sp.]